MERYGCEISTQSQSLNFKIIYCQSTVWSVVCSRRFIRFCPLGLIPLVFRYHFYFGLALTLVVEHLVSGSADLQMKFKDLIRSAEELNIDWRCTSLAYILYIDRYIYAEYIPQDNEIPFNVFFRTACNVAMVYSRASQRLGFVVEWAKNKAANKSPTPVKTMPSPMAGIGNVCLILAPPTSLSERKWMKTEQKCIRILPR